MSCSLHSLKKDYIGVLKGDSRSLRYSSYSDTYRSVFRGVRSRNQSLNPKPHRTRVVFMFFSIIPI